MIFQEKTTDDSKETASFKELLSARIQEYIEEILSPYFGGMISFVKDCELIIESGNSVEVLKRHEGKITHIVRQFNADWKKAIEFLNQDVMRQFSNFKNGTHILQVAITLTPPYASLTYIYTIAVSVLLILSSFFQGALTQLIQYYHRFQKVLSQNPFKNLPIRNELINIHNVMVEVKKHKPNF